MSRFLLGCVVLCLACSSLTETRGPSDATARVEYYIRVFECDFPIPADYLLMTNDTGRFSFSRRPTGAIIVGSDKPDFLMRDDAPAKAIERERVGPLDVALYELGPDYLPGEATLPVALAHDGSTLL